MSGRPSIKPERELVREVIAHACPFFIRGARPTASYSIYSEKCIFRNHEVGVPGKVPLLYSGDFGVTIDTWINELVKLVIAWTRKFRDDGSFVTRLEPVPGVRWDRIIWFAAFRYTHLNLLAVARLFGGVYSSLPEEGFDPAC
jgi:hypothetical protein